MAMIPVTRPTVPDFARYAKYVQGANDRIWLTNFGPLYRELTARLEEWLGVRNLLLVSNGTLALQIAYRALGLQGRVLTTPFSFVATVSSLVWEGLEPDFADIDRRTFNLDPARVAPLIRGASGIVGVHVYGNPCAVEELERLAAEAGAKVVYDGAHAFGIRHGDRSLLCWGDATALSFHATKVFHTIEGGGIVFRRAEDYELARSLSGFGFDESGSPVRVGTNAKLSEYHCAAGLALLDEIDTIIERRLAIADLYRRLLDGVVEFQDWRAGSSPGGAYVPVLLPAGRDVEVVQREMLEQGVQTRRYFHPSLDTLPYLRPEPRACPISREIASRVLCLPIYYGLQDADVRAICELLRRRIA